MWPSIFEFHWDTGHMIFFGVFYAVVIAIATSLGYVFIKSIVDSFNDDKDASHHRATEAKSEETTS
ncbi:MAG: hypothetical protein HQ583_08275 [Candidatus Abyssubacteria bacterium]|nr:hypothetical protein [Candidatus Abyssubacteria bacterium]